MTRSAIEQEFLPVILRYLYRHPTQWMGAWAYWGAHKQRVEQILQDLEILSHHDPDEILHVFKEITVQKFYRLIRRQTELEGVNAISYSPWVIALYCLVRLEQPNIVVETGVEHGMSSWVILEGMERNQKGNCTPLTFLTTKPRWMVRGGYNPTSFLLGVCQVGSSQISYVTDGNSILEMRDSSCLKSWGR